MRPRALALLVFVGAASARGQSTKAVHAVPPQTAEAAARKIRLNAAQSAVADYANLRAAMPQQVMAAQPSSNVMMLPSTPDPDGAIEEDEEVPVYFIPADRLAQHNPTQSFASLLRPTGEKAYPVLANGKPTLTVLIGQGKDGWHVSQYRSARLAAQIHAAWANAGGGSISVIRIPALEADLVAITTTKQTFLVPVSSDPSLGLVAGHRSTVAELLGRLSKAAKEVKTFPR